MTARRYCYLKNQHQYTAKHLGPRLLRPSPVQHSTPSNDILMTSDKPSIINVHTPSSSIALVHSSKMEFLWPVALWLGPSSLIDLVSNDTLTSLFDKLSRKNNTEFHGKRVGPGCLKYEWNGSVWNLDDGTYLAGLLSELRT